MKLRGLIYTTCAANTPAAGEKADKIYNTYLSNNPKGDPLTRIHVLNNLAYLYAEAMKPANPTRALPFAKKAHELMQQIGLSEPGVIDEYAYILILCGQVDEGVALLNGLVGSEKAMPEHYLHLFEGLFRKGQVDDAESALNSGARLLEDVRARGAVIDPSLGARIEAAREKLKQSRAAATNK